MSRKPTNGQQRMQRRNPTAAAALVVLAGLLLVLHPGEAAAAGGRGAQRANPRSASRGQRAGNAPGRLRSLGKAALYYGKARLHQLRGWATEKRAKISLRGARRELRRFGLPVPDDVRLHTRHRAKEELNFRRVKRELRRAGWLPSGVGRHLDAATERASSRRQREFEKRAKRTKDENTLMGWASFSQQQIILNADALRGRRRIALGLAHEGQHLLDSKREKALYGEMEQLAAKYHQNPTSAADVATNEALERQGWNIWSKRAQLNRKMEPRGFGTQARYLGRSGQRLGDRFIRRDDSAYKADRINASIARNYVRGVWDALRPRMKSASRQRRRLTGAYMQGYRQYLAMQARFRGVRPPIELMWAGVLRPPPLNEAMSPPAPPQANSGRMGPPPAGMVISRAHATRPGVLRRLGAALEGKIERVPALAAVQERYRRAKVAVQERYHRAKVAVQERSRLEKAAVRVRFRRVSTQEEALQAGRADAYQGLSPLAGAKQILGAKDRRIGAHVPAVVQPSSPAARRLRPPPGSTLSTSDVGHAQAGPGAFAP